MTGLRATAGILVAVAVAIPAAPAAAAPSDTHLHAGRTAAEWLAGELKGSQHQLTSFGQPDWGLTIDALIALSATGADPAEAGRVRDEVAAHADDYRTPAWSPGTTIAGATAKLLTAAVITGADPATFGGTDLRAATLALVRVDGVHTGRVSDATADSGNYTLDTSNAFGQSLAVIGLARSGGAPQPVVDFLIEQQCSDGGFRLDPDVGAFPQPETPSPSCDDDPAAVLDTDSTAMAVQALLAAADAGADHAAASAAAGAAWLATRQRDDGGFGGSGPTSAANSNSTGLAGQALAASGNTAAADRAADWVGALQRSAAPDRGALAYDQAAFDAGSIDDLSRDQWRRATAQALLTLTQTPLGLIGSVDPPDPANPPPPTTAPETTPPSTGPTSSADKQESGGTGGGEGLPITGPGAGTLAALGLALIAAGATLRLTARRR